MNSMMQKPQWEISLTSEMLAETFHQLNPRSINRKLTETKHRLSFTCTENTVVSLSSAWVFWPHSVHNHFTSVDFCHSRLHSSSCLLIRYCVLFSLKRATSFILCFYFFLQVCCSIAFQSKIIILKIAFIVFSLNASWHLEWNWCN